MLQVLLVRHGQTASNAHGVLQGHLPIPLNDLGRRQAAAVAEGLSRHRPEVEALVTSDLPRAVQTAEPIGRVLGLTATADTRWRERSFGSMEGQQVGDAELWRAAAGTLNPPGAEPLEAMAARVEAALVDLAQQQARRSCVAVVTHGGVVRMALRLFGEGRLALEPDHRPVEVVPILNASVLSLGVRVSDADILIWRVLYVNDVTHLPPGDCPPGPRGVQAEGV